MGTLKIKQGQPYPLGLFRTGNVLTVSLACAGRAEAGLCLFAPEETLLVLMNGRFRTGQIFSAVIENLPPEYDSYLFYENGKFFPDPYARQIFKPTKVRLHREFSGTVNIFRQDDTLQSNTEKKYPEQLSEEELRQALEKQELRCRIVESATCSRQSVVSLNEEYKRDRKPNGKSDIKQLTPYTSSFIYCLNVRGFTMQDMSIKKNERGTFKGLEQKIPYLKELGVTAVELMPVYELCDETVKEEELTVPYLSEDGSDRPREMTKRPNLWGFQDGYYFAFRTALATDKSDPRGEFLHMVEMFHAAGMEVILQFWFAPQCSGNLIMDCIRYYVTTCHIDGIHLKSDNIPEELVITDPLFADIRVLSQNRGVCQRRESSTLSRLAWYGEDFMWRARHFLKGDDQSLMPFVETAFSNTVSENEIHYICNYDGFTLRDLVTYEHKRNEANGEHSKDGRNDNISWNCGVEGETRKKNVLSLRKKQMLNALSFVFLSRGTPLLYAGDECGNTQGGNNNPYCQDNSVGWTDRDKSGKYSDLGAYVRFLVGFRQMITKGTGSANRSKFKATRFVPELSFHGVEAWKPDLGNNSHAIGVMFALADGCSFFAAINMYWEETTFALPCGTVPYKWCILSDTSKDTPLYEKPHVIKKNRLTVSPRSVVICKSI